MSNSNETCQQRCRIELWPLWPSKVGQIKNLGTMSCILIRYTYDKNLEMIQPLVELLSTFCVISFGPLVANPRIRQDRNLVCELLLPSGTYEQIFRSIAPAVTKRALLMDNGRRRRTPRDRIGSRRWAKNGNFLGIFAVCFQVLTTALCNLLNNFWPRVYRH
jgi:hypothetical protein